MIERAKDNPLYLLAMCLGLALLALAGVYIYTFFISSETESELAIEELAAPSGPPIRIAYQPMPWPDLDPDGGRIELQAHIQPYDNHNAGLLCERMPQVKDVINLVLSQFDSEEVASQLDLAVVEEQLTNALNERFGEPLIRGAFIDVGSTEGEFERMRLHCLQPSGGTGATARDGNAANRELQNWFERAAAARKRRADRLQQQRELGLIE